MSVGWSATNICHHCHARDTDYLQFPSDLMSRVRRSLESFIDVCKPDSQGQKSYCSCIVSNFFSLCNTRKSCIKFLVLDYASRLPPQNTRVSPQLSPAVLASHREFGCSSLGVWIYGSRVAELRGLCNQSIIINIIKVTPNIEPQTIYINLSKALSVQIHL